LRAVVELGRAVGVEHDLERLLARVLDTCFQLLRADRGAMVIYHPHSKAPFLTVTRSRVGDESFAVSSSVLGQVMVTHQPYLRTEVESDVVLQRSASLSAHGVRSVMAVPLRYEADETEWLGVILLDSSAMSNVFGPRDLELLDAIAGPAALAIKNAMLVRQVQSVISDEWRRLERIVRDLPLGVIVLDDNRRCVMVNQWITVRAGEVGDLQIGEVANAIAGKSYDQLIGNGRTQVTTRSERIFAIAANTMAGGGETVIVVNDVTEERERQNQAAHRDRVALIGQLAGGVAHDFNNLLHVILTYANMLEETLEDPDLRDDAHQITHAATSAAELTRQLLTFSRRELVKPKVVDVPHVVHGMEKLLLRTLGTQIDFMATIGPRIPRILIDSSQLEQILMNLVVNARDAMLGRGRVTLSVNCIDIEAERAEQRGITAGQYVEIEVTDCGSGMTPEVAARIFEPYFTTKARGKGTGLGLATVHGIVQQARGDIMVESTPGQGTTFRIHLPATQQTDEGSRPIAVIRATGGTILVVDDDDNVRRVTERILRNAGYQVLSANSGLAALAVAREHGDAIDLLLTDIVMPGMSGRDLARDLNVAHPTVRVIFMSGYHQHAPMNNSQFIPKPFTKVELLEKVHHALNDGREICVP
jgi:signal transduction histidine kinase